MDSFVADPVGFMNRWIASQSRDLELVLGESRQNLEETQSSEFYQQDRVQEALFHYVAERT